jgi:aminoglycoside phosphotransferase family enzyme
MVPLLAETPIPGDRADAKGKLQFLSSPSAYGPELPPVELRETHMSWVFLTRDLVFKLKKPVRYPFLDFSTLDARERSCREELRLNRRLAPDVYLDVVPLEQHADGGLQLGASREESRVVDWLVKMRRLPADRMLDQAIRTAKVTPDKVQALADLLAAFYRSAPKVDIAPATYADRFVIEQATSRSVLLRSEFAALHEHARRALDALDESLATQRESIADRARGGHIVEGHGDLRPEHVCLLETPVVIDCLEFNRTLRLVDPFDELAFLGLECDFAGASWIGPQLVRRCAECLGDEVAPQLLVVYTAYRALLRARLSAAHLLEPDPREPERWLPQAARYIEFARRALGPRASGGT